MNKPAKLHPRNLHHGRYNLAELCRSYPALQAYLVLNPAGEQTINFSEPAAVQALNAALLKHYYHVDYWQLPPGYLCPPIPGRADYIHTAADLLAGPDGVPTGKQITLLDIGCGANLIYPIIASRSYGWRCIGSDIDTVALKAAQLIIDSNPPLKGQISLRRQPDNNAILRGIIKPDDQFALTVCNPPFYASAVEAAAANQRKRFNLKLADSPQQRNFGGQQHELWCPGGELAFIGQMISESVAFASQVGWFSSLVSQQSHLKTLLAKARQAGAAEVKQINMQQGQKSSHLLAWRF
ncbi:MAG: 23S rRNA (adenine(1618)-N(6))-methyltransferase RlmF [Rheinheimera sp.]|uniref:23S rRNA (adenine(1618)-N(6))-methyltransferase RlmF n=1 Tax=Arsukibacterium sp. UBA3155 TaxID=1946058 RepID=UPI000C8C54D4|nr:23S rRNA (adenine(1618)-N(6))-methyltransferase RlmF [Arsukibacterium sp. UBA3155]MAD73511.1 23S rRNA (adenine(1618)-N(6))-methyltransferase RlmF [Rheinheimera sp.]|tara:strand:- start:54509 stop:55396 length:888 start_codon:yes stop_codon:yes gene_type:complete